MEFIFVVLLVLFFFFFVVVFYKFLINNFGEFEVVDIVGKGNIKSRIEVSGFVW